MQARSRALALGCATALSVTLVAGCGGNAHKATLKNADKKPATGVVMSMGAPAGLADAGAPQPNGSMWVLVKKATAANIQLLDLSRHRVDGVVPVSASASAITELSTGMVAVGTATAHSGSVELRNGTTGALESTVPVSGPVRGLAPGSNGTNLYVLEGMPAAETVTILDSQTGKVQGVVPVGSGTVAVAPSPDGSQVYAVQTNGLVLDAATAGSAVTSRFSVSGGSVLNAAMSPDGTALYVLKGIGPIRNISVVNVGTERVLQVLPAPANTVAVQVSPDGTLLYEAVGASTYGNVQAISLTQ
jgi:DNA-binding beta-propeller fold protein YncE